MTPIVSEEYVQHNSTPSNQDVFNENQIIEGENPDSTPWRMKLRDFIAGIFGKLPTISTAGTTVEGAVLLGIQDNRPKIFDATLLKGADGADADNSTLKNIPSTPVADEDMANGQIVMYLDETSDKLHIKVKYSDGSFATGEVSLTPVVPE